MTSTIGIEKMIRLNEVIASSMGINFPMERLHDLESGIRKSSKDLGFDNLEQCVDQLLSSKLSKPQIEILASHLTVGETYFFREKKLFDSIENEILPELITAKRQGKRSLKIWCAGCCTGEEPYTVAMILLNLLPDIADWYIKIWATDINVNFLKKAEQGTYGEWSFREATDETKKKYFTKKGDKNYKIKDYVKKIVKFEFHNLVEDGNLFAIGDASGLDMIFCRNVLMYFRNEQIDKVIKKFYEALSDNGFLFIGQSEFSVNHFPNFTLINNGKTMYYKKGDVKEKTTLSQWKELGDNYDSTFIIPHDFLYAANYNNEDITPVDSDPREVINKNIDKDITGSKSDEENEKSTLNSLYDEAVALYEERLYKEATEKLLTLHKKYPDDTNTLKLITRIYADRRMLKETMEWSEKAIASDKLNPLNYYLQALIQIEFNHYEKSVSLLQRAIYLDQDFVIAHFMLGESIRKLGNMQLALKHWKNALTMLKKYSPDQLIPYTEGLTVQMLSEIILSAIENRRTR